VFDCAGAGGSLRGDVVCGLSVCACVLECVLTG
jgi:hypothetical protein